MVEGDTLPQLIIRCWDRGEDGALTAQNLAGYTFTISIARPSPADVLVRTGAIVEPAAGKVVFSWDEDDWKEGPQQKAYITAVDAQGNRRSFGEFTFNVSKAPPPP